MKKSKEGIPKVTRKELNLILDRIDQVDTGVYKKRGIVLLGKPGTGKTTIMKERMGLVISSNQLATKYMLNGIEGFVNQQGNLMTSAAIIDDLGTEILPSHYGNKLDLIPYIIQLAYEQDRDFRFYTSNLNYEELVERYGSRVITRLQEKCYFIILDDTPFRELATAEKINEQLQ